MRGAPGTSSRHTVAAAGAGRPAQRQERRRVPGDGTVGHAGRDGGREAGQDVSDGGALGHRGQTAQQPRGVRQERAGGAVGDEVTVVRAGEHETAAGVVTGAQPQGVSGGGPGGLLLLQADAVRGEFLAVGGFGARAAVEGEQAAGPSPACAAEAGSWPVPHSHAAMSRAWSLSSRTRSGRPRAASTVTVTGSAVSNGPGTPSMPSRSSPRPGTSRPKPTVAGPGAAPEAR